MNLRIDFKLCALLALMTLATGVNAETWLTTSVSGQSGGDNTGDPLRFTNGNGQEMGVWGFSVNRSYRNGSISGYGSISGGATAYAFSSGLGVEKNGSAYHTLGNNNASHFDGMLLNFGTPQRALDSLTVTSFDSWSGKSNDNDRDVQIWRWIGAQPWSSDAFAFNGTNGYPSGAYPGVAASVWDSNWAKVGDYYNPKGDGTISFDVNPASHLSSAWLVLAKPNHHDTAIKIGAITTESSPSGGPGLAPIPGTLALLGIGAVALRRRHAQPG